MKYGFVIFVIVGVVASIASVQGDCGCDSSPLAALSQISPPPAIPVPPIGALLTQFVYQLLNYAIQSVLSLTVYYLEVLIVLITPAGAVVDIPVLIEALTALGNPDLNTLLTAVLALVGVNGAPVLAVIPPTLLAIQVPGCSLLEFLTAVVPPGVTTAPFALVASLLVTYLVQYLGGLLAQ